jgi:hypothetical protein
MSSAQADLTGHLPGVLCVRTVSGDWETFDQMRRLHSVVELQEIAAKQRSAREFAPSPRLQKIIHQNHLAEGVIRVMDSMDRLL